MWAASTHIWCNQFVRKQMLISKFNEAKRRRQESCVKENGPGIGNHPVKKEKTLLSTIDHGSRVWYKEL